MSSLYYQRRAKTVGEECRGMQNASTYRWKGFQRTKSIYCSLELRTIFVKDGKCAFAVAEAAVPDGLVCTIDVHTVWQRNGDNTGF